MGWGERSRFAAESDALPVLHTCSVYTTHSESKAVWCASLQQLFEVDTVIQLIVLKLDQNSKVFGCLCMCVCMCVCVCVCVCACVCACVCVCAEQALQLKR